MYLDKHRLLSNKTNDLTAVGPEQVKHESSHVSTYTYKFFTRAPTVVSAPAVEVLMVIYAVLAVCEVAFAA